MKNLSPWLNYIVGCIIGSIITLAIVYLVRANLGKPLGFSGLVVIAIAIICLFVIIFLIYASLKSSKDDPYPLGLPTGSIRALIAILILIFFVLLSIAFTFSVPPAQLDFVKDIIKTLGTLLIAVSAFYFGSKATEQGSKIIKDAFDDGIKSQKQDTTDKNADVPIEIIEEAIKTNIDKWKVTYKCSDVKAGKKQIGNTTNNLSAIVFFVKSKGEPTLDSDTSAIPATIQYNSKGTEYNISTDVQLEQVAVVEEPVKQPTGSDVPVKQPAAVQEPVKQPVEQPVGVKSSGETGPETPVEIDLNKKSEDNENT